MRLRFLFWIKLLGLSGGGFGLGGAEAPVAIAVGASKAAVVAAYGPPILVSRLGPREILKYPQGQVTLANGQVVQLDFRNAPPPRPAAAEPSVATVPDGWFGDFEVASREAAQRTTPMLVWFAGANWSAPSRQFRDEVALQDDFVAAFQARFVLVRIDLADDNGNSRDQFSSLRDRLGVTVYPTLLILSSTGDNLAKIDLARGPAGEPYLARVIAGVREMNDLLGFPPLPAVKFPNASVAATTSHRPVRAVTPGQIATSLLSAGWGVVTGVGTGLVVTIALLWLVWRSWSRPGLQNRPSGMAERIAEAASGFPTLADIMTWPKERLIVLVAALAEAEGYTTDLRTENAGEDGDLWLRRPGEPRVQGVVCCAGSKAGVITAKRVRELFGIMTAEGISFGWFAAPMGFSAEARVFADEHRIRLSDGQRLVAQLHELPPLALPKVTRQPWARV